MKKIIISFITIIFLSGCFNYNELNDYAVVEAVSIDYNKSRYTINMLIANNSKNEEKKSTVYQAKGKNIYEAFKNIELISPHKLYLGHISVVIVDEESSKKGLYNIITPFLTNNQVNKDFYIILAKDTKASKLLKSPAPITDFPSQYIANNIKSTNQTLGNVYAITFNELVKQLINQDNPTINGYIIDNKYIKANNLGFFKNDKLLGWASKSESNGINIINNKTQELYLDLKCNKENIIVNTDNIKTKLTIDKNGNSKISVAGEGTIKEINCSMDINDDNNIKYIEHSVKNEIKQDINRALTLSKKNKTHFI